jgi:hypothetical protein
MLLPHVEEYLLELDVKRRFSIPPRRPRHLLPADDELPSRHAHAPDKHRPAHYLTVRAVDHKLAST